MKITRKHLWSVVSLGRRLISYLLIIACVAYLDRLLLASLSGKTAAGLYSVYFQLSMSVVLILDAFLKAWTPWVYETLNNGSDDVSELTNSFLLFLGLGFFASILSIGVWLLLIPRLLNEDYHAYSLMIIPLALAQWFYCLHHSFSVFLINAGNPEILSRNVFLIVICQCAMNIALIPTFGAYGASIAFALTGLVMALSTALSARRHSSSASRVIGAMITHPRNWLRVA